jgi:hypothetical protein
MLIALAIVLLLFVAFAVAHLLGAEDHRDTIRVAITDMLDDI